jgi:ATP-dependent Clp protease protease subunit
MTSILTLLTANRGRARLEVQASETETTVYLFSAISNWDFDPEDWCQSFAAIATPTIHLRINSPGGDVFVARTMATAIANHPATVIAYVDGYALSAASFLVMSADEIVMSSGAFLMIHNPWTMCLGDAAEMRATAQVLDKIGASIAADYATRSGLGVPEVLAMMEAETWLSADEAVAKGFADCVVETAKPKQSAEAPSNRWDLSAYGQVPKAVTDALAAPVAEPDDAAFAELAMSRSRAEARLGLYMRRGGGG